MKESIQDQANHEVPFILRNLVEYPGAINPTTTGTIDDMDGSDWT